MSESLGLSIGVANLVAARAGRDPVTRKSVLTLFDQQPSEVGLPEENPNPAEPGLVMRGFVERVGDRTPLVASDGTKYLGDALTVEALEVMARSVGYGTPITIAVPAYWSEEQAGALREEFFAQPGLTSNGVAPTLISDATAAFAALRAEPAFPTHGLVVLCDFGASGTTVTLIDAGAGAAQVGPSVRYPDLSGDAIDQLILNRVRESAPNTDATGGLASTTRMGSLTRQLDQCRRAKEQLSTAAAATISLGSGENVDLSRVEFDELIAGPVDRFLTAVADIVQRNEIQTADLAAVAAVGGGASIPLLTARLGQRLGVAIHSTPTPTFSAAVGAAVLGELQPPVDVESPVLENPTQLATAAPPDMTQMIPGARVEEDRPLAWSEDAEEEDPVPYTGPEHSGEYAREAMAFDYAEGEGYGAEAGGLPWYKRTVLVLSLVAAGLALLLLGVVLALSLGHEEKAPVTPPSPSAPAPTEQTITVTEPNNSTTQTVIPVPPPPSTTTTTEAPVPTTTEAPVTTTTPPPATTTTTVPPITTTEYPPPTRERPRLFPRWR
jgi:Hsp70 protein